MGIGRFIHHIGGACLFIATILFIVTSISAPLVNHLGLLKVDLHSNQLGSKMYLGSFGYCITDYQGRGNDRCSSSQIGYDVSSLVNRFSGSNDNLSSASRDSVKALTNVMVLHPVAAGVCFIAFLLGLGVSIIGSIFSAVFAVLAFIVAVVAIVCDFVALSILKSHINDHTNAKATYSVAIWTALAGAALALIGAALIFVTCCAGRAKARRNKSARGSKGWNDDTPAGGF